MTGVTGWADIGSSASLAATLSMKSSRGRRVAACGCADGAIVATPRPADPVVRVSFLSALCTATVVLGLLSERRGAAALGRSRWSMLTAATRSRVDSPARTGGALAQSQAGSAHAGG